MASWLGVERVVITQGNAQQHDNANLIACLKDMREAWGAHKVRGVAVISAATTDNELQNLSDAGVTGARIMDLPGGAVGLEELEQIDARANDLGWTLAIQFDGSGILDHAPRLSALKSNWILDHHGKFFQGAAPDGDEIGCVKRLIDGGKCWFKLSGCYESSQTGGPDFTDIAANTRAIADHAPNRLVWGTNWPHNLAKTEEDYPDDGALLDTVLGWLSSDEITNATIAAPEELFGFPAS